MTKKVYNNLKFELFNYIISEISRMIKLSEKVPKNKYLVEEEFEEEEEVEEIKEEDLLEKKILRILAKGKVDSKLTLTNLLIKSGIREFELRTVEGLRTGQSALTRAPSSSATSGLPPWPKGWGSNGSTSTATMWT